ncbi:SRPBCC family protein [Ichthyenterobacterium magnum]|uniref:Polyketide cyclase/dehydrase/lipid transport protein n=1 Tax=Ichthyenterobacterium magnum TaxID=1230530 RepID=A0A420DF52_9FLAO|nr:GyrI-like domain-containing protein [Ichthyenterobacterium magnum]RKE90826.1 polyketide cyclase/dehydrase/lipid transport protein [Ichthyenterobacterium magnum]
MKALKYIFFLLLILIIGLAIYIAVQPNEFNFNRSRVIKAPVSDLFNKVNDYKEWPSFSPWIEHEPDAKLTYSENTSGVNASYGWNGEILGEGNMQTTGIEKDKSIAQRITFIKPFESESDINWTFETTNDGTKVTWSMKGKQDFMTKMYTTFSGSIEDNTGPDFDRGLFKLDSIVSSEIKTKMTAQNNFRIGDISQVNLPTQNFIGYYQKTKINHDAMTKLFMEFMPKAGMYAMQHLKYGEFTPASVFTSWDEEKGEAEFYIGLVLKKDLAPADGMSAISLPEGNTLTVSKYGNYGNGDEKAHMALDAYIKEKGLERKEMIWELYVNDPTQVKPEDIQTDIYYPVK